MNPGSILASSGGRRPLIGDLCGARGERGGGCSTIRIMIVSSSDNGEWASLNSTLIVLRDGPGNDGAGCLLGIALLDSYLLALTS